MSLLVVAPGMALDDVVRRSTPEVGVLRRADGWAIAQPRGPHGVLVEHPVHGFVLAEGLFTVIEAIEGRVARIVASPQVDLLDFDGAWRNARVLAATLHEAGWHTRVRFPSPEGIDPDRDTLLGGWTALDWRVELVLRRTVPVTMDDDAAAGWLLCVRLEGSSR